MKAGSGFLYSALYTSLMTVRQPLVIDVPLIMLTEDPFFVIEQA